MTSLQFSIDETLQLLDALPTTTGVVVLDASGTAVRATGDLQDNATLPKAAAQILLETHCVLAAQVTAIGARPQPLQRLTIGFKDHIWSMVPAHGYVFVVKKKVET